MRDKSYIITGAASGIGRATAQQLLSCGANVSAGDINEAHLNSVYQPLMAEYGERLQFGRVDVTKRDQVEAFIEATHRKFGTLDGYANIAGTGGHRLGHDAISDTPDEEYDFIMDLNVKATFIALGEVLKPSILQNHGSVVCVGSMFGQRGFKRGAVFAASKHAMVGLVKSAALEAGERCIRVNVVEPGAIDTPMHQRNMDNNMPDPTPQNPTPRLGTPEDVANVILFLLSDQSQYVTGSTYAVDGGAKT